MADPGDVAWMLTASALVLVLLLIPGLGLRVAIGKEDLGLDITLHGERGYVADGAD